MSNLKLLLFFTTTIILSFLCDREESKIVYYKLPVSNVETNMYTVSIDGKIFCYYTNGWLVRHDLSSQSNDSVYISATNTLHVNVLNSIEGFAVIYFDKNLQYDTNRQKEVVLKHFDVNLNLLDSITLLAPKMGYLLDEDFMFSSILINRLTEKIYLNDIFSNMVILEGKKWLYHWQEYTKIDISNGEIYNIEKNEKSGKNELHFKSSSGYHSLADELHYPSQFSILEDEIIYFQNRNIYWRSINPSSEWAFVAHNWFNPCKRFNEGLYHFENGTLALLYLIK